MSIWTQVCGCIRIDGIPSIDPMIAERVIDALGHTCSFDDGEAVWEACTVPCGSEGSLQYRIIPAGEGLVLYTVAVWGDLRDYDNELEIIDWFNDVTRDSGLMIRSAVLEYQIGNSETAKVIQYKHED